MAAINIANGDLFGVNLGDSGALLLRRRAPWRRGCSDGVGDGDGVIGGAQKDREHQSWVSNDARGAVSTSAEGTPPAPLTISADLIDLEHLLQQHRPAGGSTLPQFYAHRTAVGQSGFNTPHQLGLYQGVDLGSLQDARPFSVRPLRPGDVLIMATDGLFDNVEVSEMVWLAEKHLDAHGSPDGARALADALLNAALANSRSLHRPSPFSREAARHGLRYRGGCVARRSALHAARRLTKRRRRRAARWTM